ncbi:MAG: hypothetical protein RIQ50_279 [Bacteroidota bacterium]
MMPVTFPAVLLIIATLLGVSDTIVAQSVSDSAKLNLEEVVISGSKFAEKKKNIIQKIDIISASSIRKANAQNTGDLLLSTGNVFVQKSQQGGSSPVIRGFEASRVLLVVDGVRMNNAIYRSGHLQNVISIDQNMLERIEVIQGPSSTLFGSDALGGAIHMITKNPELAIDSKKSRIQSNAFARYASANQEKTIHADFNWASKKWGSLTSFTLSDFGDMRMGKRDKKGFEGFGTRPLYIQPFDGISPDTVLRNNNERIQVYSGYKQWDLMQKILFKPNERISHLLNIQHSGTGNVPRYDRLQDVRNSNLRFAEWYYGPQLRSLAAYQFKAEGLKGFFNEINSVASYQWIEESRITREYKRYDRQDKRIENIGVVGFTLDGRRKLVNDEVVTGIDIQLNDLQSRATRTNLLNGQLSKLDTRYPDGKNTMNYAAVYIQHIHKFNSRKWVLNQGIRIQYVSLQSSIIDNSFFQLPVTQVNQKNWAATGNIGVVHSPNNRNTFKVGYSSGFRAPNIDDLSKIFESSTAARQVVVPNSTIRPEYTHTLDIAYAFRLGKGLELEADLYYTRFNNALVKAPYRLNGKDSIEYYGVTSQVLANQNINRAYVWGGNIELRWKIDEHWKIIGNCNWQEGRFLTDPSKRSAVFQKQQNGTFAIVQANVKTKPLDHIPPSFGKWSIAYESKKGYAEVVVLFNGWKRLNLYNADGEDNAQYATSQGTPEWSTFNFRSGYNLTKRVLVQFNIENLLDRNYRYFASGFSAPGRSLVFAIRTSL